MKTYCLIAEESMAKAMTSETHPIDAVITWVDGNDPIHRQKRLAALAKKSGESEIPIAAGRDDTRFQDNGELWYCIASIRKFAPWIRYIHLVTDNQIPSFLTSELMQEYRIRIVDHREIFRSFEWALPTFNSRAIETAMWRISELAPRFIYMNDDFLITKELYPDDFFSDRKVILRGTWRPIKKYDFFRIFINKKINYFLKKFFGITRTMHLYAQMRGAQLAGFQDNYYRSPHIPHPIYKKTLESFFKDNPYAFSKNISFKFRDMSQYWTVSLANHIEILNKNALLNPISTVLIINGEYHSKNKIKKILHEVQLGQVSFLCLGSLEKISYPVRKNIDKVLRNMLEI